MSPHERWRPRKVTLDLSDGGEEAEAIDIVAVPKTEFVRERELHS